MPNQSPGQSRRRLLNLLFDSSGHALKNLASLRLNVRLSVNVLPVSFDPIAEGTEGSKRYARLQASRRHLPPPRLAHRSRRQSIPSRRSRDHRPNRRRLPARYIFSPSFILGLSVRPCPLPESTPLWSPPRTDQLCLTDVDVACYHFGRPPSSSRDCQDTDWRYHHAPKDSAAVDRG